MNTEFLFDLLCDAEESGEDWLAWLMGNELWYEEDEE